MQTLMKWLAGIMVSIGGLALYLYGRATELLAEHGMQIAGAVLALVALVVVTRLIRKRSSRNYDIWQS